MRVGTAAPTFRCLGMRQGERGQILPGLLVVMLALLAVGVLMFQVGKAAVLRSSAQTAADAAALAGAREIKRQQGQQHDQQPRQDLSAFPCAHRGSES